MSEEIVLQLDEICNSITTTQKGTYMNIDKEVLVEWIEVLKSELEGGEFE